MHVMVALHLGRRAMRTIMVALGLIGHCAGRQREIQPDGGKQPEGAAAPDSALALYAARIDGAKRCFWRDETCGLGA
jgi:hypothetical protein